MESSEADAKAPHRLPSREDTLIVEAVFPQLSPQTVFAHGAEPELLARWWPPVAEVDPRVGGRYHFSWPAQEWDLRGEFTCFHLPGGLGFTWTWDHDPDAPTTEVAIVITGLQSGGSRLHLTHGTYESSYEGRDIGQGHLEERMYFLSRLHDMPA